MCCAFVTRVRSDETWHRILCRSLAGRLGRLAALVHVWMAGILAVWSKDAIYQGINSTVLSRIWSPGAAIPAAFVNYCLFIIIIFNSVCHGFHDNKTFITVIIYLDAQIAPDWTTGNSFNVIPLFL